MSDTKRKPMQISNAVMQTDAPIDSLHLTAEAYKPAKTLVPESIRLAQDSALRSAGAYTLIEHAINMGLFGLGSQFMGYPALSGLTQDGLIAACVNTLANDMTREFAKISMSGTNNDPEGDKLVADIEELIVKHKIRRKFNTAAKWTQQFGGCQLFIDTGKTDPDDLIDPLNDTEIRNDFEGFVLVEPVNTSPGKYDTTNPLSPAYFKPQTWWVMAQEIHATRMITFTGDAPPTLLKPAYNFYGIPHVQRIYDAVLHYKQNMLAVGRLLNKYSCMVFKTNLEDIFAAGGLAELDKRIALFTKYRNNDSTFAIDFETEDVVLMQTSLAGVKDILQQSLEYVAALDRKPAVKLLGISPSGFSTGATDIDNYYDNVATQQNEMFGEPLQRVIEVLQISMGLEVNKNLIYKFVELSEEDELQAAQIRKTEAETGAVLIANSVVSPQEERARIKMTESSGYDNLTDDDVDADDEMVDLITGMLENGENTQSNTTPSGN